MWPPFDCNQGDPKDVGECLAIGDEEDICPNIIDCMCDNCACEILDCDQDPYCKSVRQCAVETYCRGMEYLIGCDEQIFTAGELMSVKAIQVAYCSEDNDCSRFCREPILDITFRLKYDLPGSVVLRSDLSHQ